jgi:O-antigen/teichoic acid export membrane protein
VNVTASSDTLPFRIRSRFILDTLSLTAGAAAAQCIGIAVSPVLTRLYSANDFGVFSLFAVIVSTGSAFACLGYEPAILLPRDDSEGASILVGCMAISALVAGVSLVVILLLGSWLANYLKAPGLRSLLWWVPVTFVALGTYQGLSYWVNRRRRFIQLSASRVWQAAATAVSQIGGGVATGGAMGLVYGQIIGQLLSSSVLVFSAVRSDLRLLRQGYAGLRALIALMARYRHFPQYSTWGTLMNTASFQLVPILLFALYGPGVAGFYFLGLRVVSIPLSLVGVALGQVLLQRSAAQLSEGHSISRLVERVVGVLILVSAPLFLLLVPLAPRLFTIVFGQHWLTAGYYIQGLAPLFLLQFITSPVSVVLLALRRQKVLTCLQGLLLVGTLGAFAVAWKTSSSPMACVALYSLSVGSVYILYLFVILRYASTSLGNVLRGMLAYRSLIQRA